MGISQYWCFGTPKILWYIITISCHCIIQLTPDNSNFQSLKIRGIKWCFITYFSSIQTVLCLFLSLAKLTKNCHHWHKCFYCCIQFLLLTVFHGKNLKIDSMVRHFNSSSQQILFSLHTEIRQYIYQDSIWTATNHIPL